MKNRCLVLLLTILVGIPMRVLAQPGFSATIPQLAGKNVALSAYTGLDVVTVDSLLGDASGHFVYEPVLPVGMYFLNGPKTYLEFLSVGKPVALRMDDIDDEYGAIFSDSPENTRWTAYLDLRERYRYGRDNPMAFHRLTDSLIGDSNDYAVRLIRSDREEELYPSDFQDPDLIPTNVLTTKIVHRLELSDNDFILGSDQILNMAKVDMKGYGFALQYLLKGFTALGLSNVTGHLLNFPCIAEGEISEEEGQWLETLVEPYQKVRVGVKAPDIQMVTIDGKPYHLYASEAEHILVLFWAADCEYCHDFMRSIKKNLDLGKTYELVTFVIADSEKETQKELRKMKLDGWHCYDEARWEGKAFLDYHVTSTPTVFLLDKDKTIVCKPYDWNELKEWLDNNKY